jgi:hypothetical protein
MSNVFKFIVLTLVISTAVFTSAQPPAPAPYGVPDVVRTPLPLPSLKTRTESDVFYSADESFSISLPKWRNTFRKLSHEETRGVSVGGQYKWTTAEATITVSQLYITSGEGFDSKESYEGLEIQMKELLLSKIRGAFVSSKPIRLSDYRGVEIVFILPNGVKGISRVYASGRRQYMTNAFITAKTVEGETLAIGALDSFRILTDADRKDEITRRVEAATPKDLPQSPVPARSDSDAKELGLKGRVKTVVSEREYIRYPQPSERSKNLEAHFNESGNLIKSITFDYRHNPDMISVFGYLDGARVQKNGWVTYEYDPPPPMAVPLPPGTKPPFRDQRYSSKYIYVYDKDNRRIEKKIFDNTGELTSRSTYTYEGNKREEIAFDRKGEQRVKTIETLDSNGRVIEEKEIVPSYPESIRTFKYESFDSNGNWTVRTVTGKRGNRDGTFSDYAYIEYQTLTYY